MLETKNCRVLMVCTTFPPQSDIGGLRPAMFSKYLPLFGWNPVIFTRTLPEDDPMWQPTMEIYGLPTGENRLSFVYGTRDEKEFYKKRSPFTLLRHFASPDLVQPPGLAEKMISESRKMLSKEKISVVLATSPPLGGMTAAAYIAKCLNVPWIADFRDINEQSKGMIEESFRSKLLDHRVIFRRKRILRSASEIITVSEYLAGVLEKSIGRKVHVIQNGFDPSMFNFKTVHRSEKFSIVCMGRLLSEWRYEPKPLFEAIDLLLNNGTIDGKDLDILFYATDPSVVETLSSSYQCKKFVRTMPRVEYQEVPKILNKSCILLLLTNKRWRGLFGTKLFEYLGAKKPILCVPGDGGGELDAMLRKTNAGVTCPTPESVVNVLEKWYDEWKQTGTVKCNSIETEVEKYSRKNQAGQLANILNSACSNR